jgi:hypothetical protein
LLEKLGKEDTKKLKVSSKADPVQQQLEKFEHELRSSLKASEAIGKYEDRIAQIEFQGKKFNEKEAAVWLEYIQAFQGNTPQEQ